jgi:hypothetical protein
MEWAALFKVFQSWGPSAISSALVVVTLYLIKKVDKNGEDDKKRAQNFMAVLEAKIKELRADVYKVLEDHGRRLSYIEMEYVKRETFYRELGGWRDDINRISGQIVTLAAELNRSIIELWKKKGRQ